MLFVVGVYFLCCLFWRYCDCDIGVNDCLVNVVFGVGDGWFDDIVGNDGYDLEYYL